MSNAPLAGQCIRCGSKEHTTRDHDEGRIPGGKPVAPKKAPPKRPVTAPGATDAKAKGVLQHRVCWKSIGRRPGIPDIVEKPLIDRYVDRRHEDESTCARHIMCPCLSCENKRKKAALDALRRQGKA